MPWNIDLNLNIDSLLLLSYFIYHLLEGVWWQDFSAGMEAKPLLFFPSTKYPGLSVYQVSNLIQFFG